MDSVNTLQIIGQFRILLAGLGMVAGAFGLLTKEQISALNDDGLWTGIAGLAVTLTILVLAWRSRSTKNMIKATADFSQVAEIQTTPRLADAIPNDKVVPADLGVH